MRSYRQVDGNMIEAHRLDIPSDLYSTEFKDRNGVFSYIAFSLEIAELLMDKYGKAMLCLKVFKKPADVLLDEYTWGDRNLVMSTKIQNIFAWHGFSPRVYDIVRLPTNQYAQVTDYLTGEFGGNIYDYKGVMASYGIRATWDMNKKNWIDGQLVDFGFFRIREDFYKAKLYSEAHQYAAWGSSSDPYQSVDGFGMSGQRHLPNRSMAMKLYEVDFRGKTVLDMGCSLGNISRKAYGMGAKRVLGVDIHEVPRLAYEFSNWLGYWNVDFMEVRLPRDRAHIPMLYLDKFDVVFALSVDRQIGYDAWMADMCKEVFYLEGHVPDNEETYRKRLEQDFARVEYLGMSRDHGPRPVFRCYKEA